MAESGGATPKDEELAAAVDILRSGGLVAFPTETVYGLGADASNPSAVRRIFAAKGRPAGHPLIVHLGRAEEIGDWSSSLPSEAHRLADAFWPGPLTMLLPRGDRVPDEVTGGRPSVGLRVPDHPVARRLLQRFGGGLAAPSANRFGRVSPTTADHVRADLGDAVDLVLDGGACTVGVESTIVDLTGDVPEVLRPGGVDLAALTAVLGATPRVWTEGPDEQARAPGMLASHYAPDAAVELAPSAEVVVRRARECVDEGRRVGVFAPEAIVGLPPGIVELEPAGTDEAYAQLLYRRLRQADEHGLDVLLVVPPSGDGIARAVVDRLRRAAYR